MIRQEELRQELCDMQQCPVDLASLGTKSLCSHSDRFRRSLRAIYAHQNLHSGRSLNRQSRQIPSGDNALRGRVTSVILAVCHGSGQTNGANHSGASGDCQLLALR